VDIPIEPVAKRTKSLVQLEGGMCPFVIQQQGLGSPRQKSWKLGIAAVGVVLVG